MTVSVLISEVQIQIDSKQLNNFINSALKVRKKIVETINKKKSKTKTIKGTEQKRARKQKSGDDQ